MELINEKTTIEVNKYPSDWSEINLGVSSILKARIGWQGLTTAEYLNIGDYYLITGTDFLNGFIDWDNCVYVEKERYVQDKNIQIGPEDILVTKDGTIGKVAFIEEVTLPTTLNSGVFVIRPKRGDYHPRYLYHILMSEHFKDFLGKLTAGSTISHLYQKDFVHYEFPAPPTLTEQKAIATALSDVDELISNLDELIVKKKAIKQGAMQQLLTPPHKGGKRLPGFGGEWEEKKLGDIGSFKNGMNKGAEDFGHGFPFVNLMDVFGIPTITSNKHLGLVNSNNEEQALYNLKLGDVLFVRSSVKPSGVGLTSVVLKNLNETVFSGFLIRYRAHGELDTTYKIHCFHQKEFRNKVIAAASSSANTNINQEALKSLVLTFPKNIEEQKAIGQILSCMDAELDVLESKRAKYRDIKQGMMQELLTGKTRLV